MFSDTVKRSKNVFYKISEEDDKSLINNHSLFN